LQRFDYAQILDLSLAVIFPMLTQPILITLMVAWGKSHTVFGASIGGLLGLGMAAYAAELLTFLLGMWLYRRLGYNARLYFLAHFDWSVIKDSFRFGVFEMLGSAAWGIGQSVEILISQAYLVNYAEVWGNWVLAQNFVYAFNVTSTLYNNLMPSISEAISHGRKMLSQYYSSMGYKWGGMISAMLGALLLAVVDRFILGASGPEFVRAAQYSTPLLIWGIIQYPSWVGDNVQLGTNKPWMKGALVSMEQLIRIILAFILLARLQINALIIAYIVALMTKNIIAYWVNHKLCFPQRFYFWQSLGAPFLAGLVHYAVVRWIGGLIWRGDQMTSILILTIAILPSYPIFAFFYGLFGGWDDATLEEVRRAVELSTFMKPFAWLFWKSTSLGARISPLHNRFPITNRQAALDEAVSLTHERVNL
jgi:O-antigen/teichoic acid export membrane protein